MGHRPHSGLLASTHAIFVPLGKRLQEHVSGETAPLVFENLFFYFKNLFRTLSLEELIHRNKMGS
jgi:hypothetical protein